MRSDGLGAPDAATKHQRRALQANDPQGFFFRRTARAPAYFLRPCLLNPSWSVCETFSPAEHWLLNVIFCESPK
jgi:hypothetical protein